MISIFMLVGCLSLCPPSPHRIGLDGKVIVFNPDSKRGDGQAFGPDGRLYAVATNTQQILAYDADGRSSIKFIWPLGFALQST